jgi:hypothetical protein
MRVFPESAAEYKRLFFLVLLLWIVGVLAAFFGGDFGKNFATGTGLGNSLVSFVAVILVLGSYSQQQELRTRDERRQKDTIIQAHFFQLLTKLPELLPEHDVETLRSKSPMLRDVLRIYFRESRTLELDRDEILHDLAEHQLKDQVPPSGRFRRRDLLLALHKLRCEASAELRSLLDRALRATLSDEQRRLLILQGAYDQDLEELGFLGAAGIISDVLNEMPDLVNFLLANFPPDSI